MKSTIVRLPDFIRSDDHVYQLNWLEMVRRQGHRLEIFTRFVSEAISTSSQEHYDCWVRLTDLPFLILGSSGFARKTLGATLYFKDLTGGSFIGVLAMGLPNKLLSAGPTPLRRYFLESDKNAHRFNCLCHGGGSGHTDSARCGGGRKLPGKYERLPNRGCGVHPRP